MFGLIWSKDADCIRVKDVNLDMKANTKRSILASLNSVFDPFGVCLPIFNHARLFLHKLQLDKDLSWDCPLSTELQIEWIKIVKQVNNSPVFNIERSCGVRTDTYDLICFTDASRWFYRCVLYFKNLSTNKVSFILAKNKIINEQLNKNQCQC